MGQRDDIFGFENVREFHLALERSGVESSFVIVPNAGHAFDSWAVLGDPIDIHFIRPAVEWVAKFALLGQDVDAQE